MARTTTAGSPTAAARLGLSPTVAGSQAAREPDRGGDRGEASSRGYCGGVNQLDVVGVRVEMPSQQPIVLLKEASGERYLPIWIGAGEATAIALALRTNSPIFGAEEVLEEAGIAIPDEQEDEVEKFREFLDQISPEDFGGGPPPPGHRS